MIKSDMNNIYSIIHLELGVKDRLKKIGFEDEVILKNRVLIRIAIEETVFRITNRKVDYSKDKKTKIMGKVVQEILDNIEKYCIYEDCYGGMEIKEAIKLVLKN